MPVEITIADEDESFTLVIPAEEEFPLDRKEVIFETVGDRPGALTPIPATAEEETLELSIPVRDGTLECYVPYLPE